MPHTYTEQFQRWHEQHAGNVEKIRITLTPLIDELTFDPAAMWEAMQKVGPAGAATAMIGQARDHLHQMQIAYLHSVFRAIGVTDVDPAEVVSIATAQFMIERDEARRDLRKAENTIAAFRNGLDGIMLAALNIETKRETEMMI